jgi:hypothetical protein
MQNNTSDTYEAISIDATFYDDQDFRHGPLKARLPFLLLGPGEQCPFSVELAARNVEAFLLHPNGRKTLRQSAPVQLSGLSMAYSGSDSVRITGVATNPNAFMIKNVAVAGVLTDASGQVVSLGWTFVLEENIVSGASVAFDLRVERVPFYRYRLYAQAERDWE